MEYKIITLENPLYPESLRSIDDPPKELYCMGDLSLLSMEMVAVVGSRKLSSYGRLIGTDIAKKLAKAGVCVVSGMVRGIDACAHEGALMVDGKTIAVLGTGPDVCYPAINRNLKEKITERGLIVTEYPPGHPVRKFNFPRRNRIISGLSKAVIIAEAGLNSGSLITAEMAVSQGRDVYAVPCNINNQYGMGGNLLIRDGAIPLVVLSDIYKYLGLENPPEEDSLKGITGDERVIYQCLRNGREWSIDELSGKVKIPPGRLNGIITVMEMKGILHTSLGKIFIAK